MDQALLNFAKTGSPEAFRQVVDRYINQIHAQAVRELADPALADDVTQAVFILLSREASRMKGGVILGGWLHRATHYACLNVTRAEARRRKHEQTAATMKRESDQQTQATWEQVRPMLDDLLERLGQKDRDAVVLRFIENRSMREIGEHLGISEDAARQRVGRTVDRLRSLFAAKGAIITAAGLTLLLDVNVSQAATTVPASLAAGISAGFGSATPAATNLAKGVWIMWTLAKIKSAAAITSIALGLAGVAWMATMVLAQIQTAPVAQTPAITAPAPVPATAPAPGAGQANVDVLMFKLFDAFKAIDERAIMECFLFSDPLEDDGLYQMLRVDLAQLRLARACREAFQQTMEPRVMSPVVSDVVKIMLPTEPSEPPVGDTVLRPMPPAMADIFRKRTGPARAWADVHFAFKNSNGVWKWDVRKIGQFVISAQLASPADVRKVADGYVKCIDAVTEQVKKKQITAVEVNLVFKESIDKFNRENAITGLDFLPNGP